MLPVLELPHSHECLCYLRFENVNRCFQVYKFTPYFYTKDLTVFMSAVTPCLLGIMRQLYTTPCKMQLSMKFHFIKEVVDDSAHIIRMTQSVITNEKQARIFNGEDANDYIDMAVEQFDNFVMQWSEFGLGWFLDHIINLTLRVSLVKLVSGGKACKLPQELQHKQAVLNLDSPDGLCLQHAIVGFIHHSGVADQKINVG